MADYATPLDLIDASQAAHEVTANANFDATSGAATFGRHASTTAALTWGYIGGRFNGTAIANGTLALTASTTNYIVVHKTTLAITVSTSNTNWNNTSTYGRCYKVTTGSAAVTNYEDHREAIDGTGIFSPNIGAGGGLLAANNLSDVASASTSRTNLGLVAIASSGSASDLSAGTVPAARMPALTGDVTTSAGAVATTITALAVTTGKIAASAVTTAKISVDADLAIGSHNLTGVGGIHLDTGAIAYYAAEYNAGNSGTSITITWSNGQNQKVTLNNSPTITIGTPPGVGRYQLRIIEDGTGGHTISWAGSAYSASRWLAATAAPGHNNAVNGETLVTFFYDGTNLTQGLSKIGAA